MKSLRLALASLGMVSLCFSADPPAGAEQVIDDNFERKDLGKGWAVQTGSWAIRDGVLHGSEIPADKHSAAARRVIETEDATYQLRFRMREGAKSFHFGFDPKRGTLDKKGHLFSVIINPDGWRILKHIDKAKPKEDPNEILAKATHTFQTGEWYSLRVTTQSTAVKAVIEGLEPLSANHPSFGVPKPTLVFRVIGDGVDIDDLRVWSAKQ
ncbi:MAG: hypothetical protein P1U87_11830 [Verrucomicrobiales bacterium]|nr:hypothetical protein [Verrucomicrobiales bacterium]